LKKIVCIMGGVTLVVALFFSKTSYAQVPQVRLAGVSFSGDAQTVAARFPYSKRYEQVLNNAGIKPYDLVKVAIANTPHPGLDVQEGQIAELKGLDQALVVSLVVSSETVSVEQFGPLRKLFVLIRGQTLFFDFKSMTVVRAYPVSFAYIDTFDRQPTEDEILDRVRRVYEGTPNKPGLYARFADTLAKATLPTTVSRYLQVSRVSLGPEVVNALPDYLKSSASVAETWAADLVSEAISTRLGVPLIPYSKGSAIGNVMSVWVSDSTVFTLKLPTPDYEISVDLTGLKKIKYGEVNAGASFIYGSYATLKIEEPLSGTTYMNTALKNGEVKVVPMTQNYVDDFPAYYDSINGLFKKLADAVSGKESTWVKSAAAAPDIESQITKTRELINLCK
jgi:hypothetical protein